MKDRAMKLTGMVLQGTRQPDPIATSGPTPSPAYTAYLADLDKRRTIVRAGQALLLLLFLFFWEAGPRLGWINPMLTSYPSAVAQTLAGMIADGSLALHSMSTFGATIIGFTGGMVIGLAVAVALWLSPMLYRVLDPFIVVLNALPKIALVPIFYIWLGADASIYAMAIAISVFITIIMLYTGFKGVDPEKQKLVRTFGGTRLQVLTKVILPGAVPSMIATLKVNIGLALVGVVVGEFQAASSGLGYLIVYGSQIFQMNLVMASIVALAVISVALFVAVQILEKFVTRRRGLSNSG